MLCHKNVIFCHFSKICYFLSGLAYFQMVFTCNLFLVHLMMVKQNEGVWCPCDIIEVGSVFRYHMFNCGPKKQDLRLTNCTFKYEGESITHPNVLSSSQFLQMKIWNFCSSNGRVSYFKTATSSTSSSWMVGTKNVLTIEVAINVLMSQHFSYSDSV